MLSMKIDLHLHHYKSSFFSIVELFSHSRLFAIPMRFHSSCWCFFPPSLSQLPICHFCFTVSQTVNQSSDFWLIKSLYWIMRAICLLVTNMNLPMTTPLEKPFYFEQTKHKQHRFMLIKYHYKIYWKRLRMISVNNHS